MRMIHTLVVALAVGAAGVAGVYAATHTVRLGPTATAATASDAEIAVREQALAQTERQLRRALARRPPGLPPLPRFKPVRAPKTPPPPAPRVIVVPAASPAPPQARHDVEDDGGEYEHDAGEGDDD